MNIIIYIYVFIFGSVIGSFLNCLIWRLHKGESIMGRSYCPKCKHQIAWYDNVPILSFIILGGKCRYCGKKISWQYPVVELVTGILFVVSLVANLSQVVFAEFPNFQFPISNFQIISNFQNSILTSHFLLLTCRDWFLIAVMIIIFIYDLRWYLILDIVTLPACLVVFILNLFIGFTWQNLLISGIIGSSFFLIQFLISRGKWIGGGDVRLGLLVGFALGWPNVILAIFLAYIIGSLVGIGLIVAGQKKWSSKLPLGTFIALSTVIILFFGKYILSWIL